LATPSVRGCNLPDDLLYDVENHMWYRVQGDGAVRLGMRAVATAMAGKSCGTPGSGKWVGPASSVGGESTRLMDTLHDLFCGAGDCGN
jgi:glycine cleavage system H protein